MTHVAECRGVYTAVSMFITILTQVLGCLLIIKQPGSAQCKAKIEFLFKLFLWELSIIQ